MSRGTLTRNEHPPKGKFYDASQLYELLEKFHQRIEGEAQLVIALGCKILSVQRDLRQLLVHLKQATSSNGNSPQTSDAYHFDEGWLTVSIRQVELAIGHASKAVR